MGKCNCTTPRIQKNRYNPCTNETEASTQYYNKDQILAMIQEIMADKATLTAELTNILSGNISQLQEILNEVSEKEETIKAWIEGFIATQYSQLFNEIIIYLTALANGTTQYDPNVIQDYIDQLEDLDPDVYPWVPDMIEELESYMPSKDNTGDAFVYTYDKGIKSIAYRWGFGVSSEDSGMPEEWFIDELAFNQLRGQHLGEWAWTEQTFTYTDDTQQIFYTHEFIPSDNATCTITREYGTVEDFDGLVPEYFYPTITEALQNATASDVYVVCRETSVVTIDGQTTYENNYYIVMKITRDGDGNVVIYNSGQIWAWNDINEEWYLADPDIGQVSEDSVKSIIEYYNNLLNQSNTIQRVTELTGYLALVRGLYNGEPDWVTAVSQNPTSFENEEQNGLIDDLRKALETLDPGMYSSLIQDIENFIAWYELIKTYVNNSKQAEADFEHTAGTITFNDKDWLTQDMFDKGVQKILDTINEIGEKEDDCSCKTPMELLRAEIETLKGKIESLTAAISNPAPTPVQETDIPCYVAMPYFKRPCFQNIAEKGVSNEGCGPGWFPITPMAFATQQDALDEKANWENGNNGEEGGMGYNRPDLLCSIVVSDPYLGEDGRYYIWIESFTFNGNTFNFPFVSAFTTTDSFSLNPFTIHPMANVDDPGRVLTTDEKYMGLFKGSKNLKLDASNIPSHTHGKEVAGVFTNVLTTEKSDKHSHNVKWGDNNYTSDTAHYYVGKTSGGQTFMSRTQARYKMAVDTWYGQGNKPGEIANSGFVQKDGEHSHTVTIPYFGEGKAFKNTPYGYFVPYVIRLAVPEDIRLKRKYDVATNY